MCLSPSQCSHVKGLSAAAGPCACMQVIEFRWAQLIWERFKQRDLQFLGSEYMPCGHLPSKSALVFVENHDRQSNCHVPDPEVPCNSLTYKDGELYKVRHQAKVTHTAAKICKRNNVCFAIAELEILRTIQHQKWGLCCDDGNNMAVREVLCA